MRPHGEAAVNQVLDRIGDLEPFLKLGAIWFTESKISEPNMYADQRQVAYGSFGFSTRRTTLPLRSSATPNICGSGTRASRICAAGFSRAN